MEQPTKHESFVNLTAMLERPGRLTQSYANAFTSYAGKVREVYADKIQTEKIDQFFKETPDFDSIVAGAYHKMATDDNSEHNVSKHIEKGDIQGAEKFLVDYLESASGVIPELGANIEGIKSAMYMRDKSNYKAWKAQLQDGNLEAAAETAGKYLNGMVGILGADDASKEVIAKLSSRETAKKILDTEKTKKDLESQLITSISQSKYEELKTGLIEYLNKVADAYGEDERFESIKEEARQVFSNEGNLAEKVCHFKRSIDKYANFEGYKAKLLETVDQVRGIHDANGYRITKNGKEMQVWRNSKGQFTKKPEMYLNALKVMESQITSHLQNAQVEKRAEKSAQALQNTWYYLQEGVDKKNVDLKNINLDYVRTNLLPKKQIEILNAITPTAEENERFKAFAGRVYKNASDRQREGQNIMSATFSEIGKELEDRSFPQRAYEAEFPLHSEFVSIEDISKGKNEALLPWATKRVHLPVKERRQLFPTFSRWARSAAAVLF